MQNLDTILYHANNYKVLIDKANKLTEAYVSEHKLILTGGMAIDLPLISKVILCSQKIRFWIMILSLIKI